MFMENIFSGATVSELERDFTKISYDNFSEICNKLKNTARKMIYHDKADGQISFLFRGFEINTFENSNGVIGINFNKTNYRADQWYQERQENNESVFSVRFFPDGEKSFDKYEGINDSKTFGDACSAMDELNEAFNLFAFN